MTEVPETLLVTVAPVGKKQVHVLKPLDLVHWQFV